MNIFNFFTGKTNSKEVAKNRLKVVLLQDKSGISEEVLQKIQAEIMQVIGKYIEMDDQALDVGIKKIETDGGDIVNALVANIPIKTVKK